MRIKISFKMVAMLLFLSLFLFASLAFFSLNGRKKDLVELFIEKADATGHSLEAIISTQEDLRNKDKIINNIYKLMLRDADIINIDLNTLEEGVLKTIVSNTATNIRKAADQENVDVLNNNTAVARIIKNGKSESLKVVTPLQVFGKIIGTIQVDFTLKSVNERLNLAINNLIFGYSLIILVFIIAIYLFTKLIVINPILKINKGLEEIVNDNLDYKITLKTKDEFGRLAEIFNKMAGELKELRGRGRAKTRELEIEVKKRTAELNLEKGSLENKVRERTTELEKLKNDLEKTVKERTATLEYKFIEIEKMNRLMVDRELRMADLKDQIKKVKK